MKQTLQLKLSQHLTLTPQLQQSIRLLQLSTLELNSEVERMLQENPLLEREEGAEGAEEPVEVPLSGPGRVSDVPERVSTDAHPTDDAPDRAPSDDTPSATDFSEYSGGDGDWGGGASEDDDYFPQQVAASTLRDHLLSQLSLPSFSSPRFPISCSPVRAS